MRGKRRSGYLGLRTVPSPCHAASRDSVRVGDTTIDYEIRRSARRKKTVEITLVAGGVQVAAPSRLPKREIQQIVLKKASWIIKRLSETEQEAPPKRFVSGETLPYLGRNVRLIVEAADVPSVTVRFNDGSFRVTAPHSHTGVNACPCQPPAEGEGGQDSRPPSPVIPAKAGIRAGGRLRGKDGKGGTDEILDALVEWYKSRAAEHLPAEVDRWWDRLGTGNKSRILIRNQRSRWGSCAHDGTLRFNWRMMMLDPSLIEYIVVHELAHLTFMDHSANFWNLVAQVLPDAQQRRRRLREAGKALPL